MSKNKKQMRKVRSLKRTRKKRAKKNDPNRKDRAHYLAKERAAIVDRRTGRQFDFELPPDWRKYI